MWRWPFHPVLRFVLAFVLVGWVLVVAVDVDPNNRGWLTSLVGRGIGSSKRYQTFPTGPGSIEFTLTKFATTIARHEYVDSPKSLPVIESGIPVASVYSPAPRSIDFGLIYPAISYYSEKSVTIWHVPKEEWGYTDQMLEDAFVAYRNSVIAPGTANTLRFSSGQLGAVIALQNRTTLHTNQSFIDIFPSQIAGELAYYIVFVWWLLTLRYARGLWPRPDGTRCPCCNYPTEGLPSPTCPECGLRHQAHAS